MAQYQQVRIHLNEEKKEISAKPLAEFRDSEGYDNDIVPIVAVVSNMLAITTEIPSSVVPDDDGPISGFQAMFSTVSKLYFFSKNPRWLVVRDKVCLGLIKDTKKHGNTSVSMGAANEFVRNIPNTDLIGSSISNGADRIFVGFLNCGTGGVKYQLYCLEKGILYIYVEYKPKEGIAASPNGLKVMDYIPKKEILMTDNQKLLKANMEYVDTELVPQGVKCHWFAFITGPWREAWEKASPEQRRGHEEKAIEFFGCVPFIKPLAKKTFFMHQDDEGTLELNGTQQMYKNLLDSNLLDKVKVIGSFGIGRGSCQWMIEKLDGTYELTGHNAGMTDDVRLAGVGQVITNGYKDVNKFNRFLDVLETTLKNGLVPVIALKSGCTILLEKNKVLRAEFSKLPEVKEQDINFPISLSSNMFCWEISQPITDPTPISPWSLRKKLVLEHKYLCGRYNSKARQGLDTFVSTLASENSKLISAMYSGLETLSYLDTLRTKSSLVPDVTRLLDQTYVSVGKEQMFENQTIRTTSMMTGVGINANANRQQLGIKVKSKDLILGIKITNEKIEITLMHSDKENGVVEVRTEEVKVSFSNLRIGDSQIPAKGSEIKSDDLAQMLSECLNKFSDAERSGIVLCAIVGAAGDKYEEYHTMTTGGCLDNIGLSKSEMLRQQGLAQSQVNAMDIWVTQFLTKHQLLTKFGIRPWSLSLTHASFYVRSDQSSWLETVATTFHNKYVFPEGRVVLVLDTNKTQTRVWLNQVGGKAKSVIHPHGLNDAKYLFDPTYNTMTSLRSTVEKYLEQTENLQSFCDVLRETIDAGYKPLIALKSGQALLFNKQPQCLESLLD